MTWPWRKLFKEFILGEQNLFFSLIQKKEREREREGHYFSRMLDLRNCQKFTWLGAHLQLWTHRSRFFAVLLFFLNEKTVWLKEKK